MEIRQLQSNSMQTEKKGGNHLISFSRTAGSPIIRNSVLQNITNQSFRRSTISTSKSKNENRNSLLERSRIKDLPNYEKYSMGNNLPFVLVFQTIQIQRLSEQVQLQRVKIKECERLMFNSSSFQVQIKELSEKCTNYESELNEYRQQLQKMNKICEKFYHQNQFMKSKIKATDLSVKQQLQQQLAKNNELWEQLQQKGRRMSELERTKQTQIEEIKSLIEKQRKSMLNRQIKQIQIRHQAEIAQLMIQIRRVSELVESKDSIIEDLKSKNKNSEDYINQLKTYDSKLNEYEEKICLLSQEHLRLSQIIDLNSTQLNNARKIELRFNKQLKTYKELQIDIQNLNQIIAGKEKEQASQRQRIKQLEQSLAQSNQLQHKLIEVTNNMVYVDEENVKLLGLVRKYGEQIEKIKGSMGELERENSKYKQYETVLIQTEKKYKLLQMQSEKMEEVSKMKERQMEKHKSRCETVEAQLTVFIRLENEKQIIEEKYKNQEERINQLQGYIQKIQQQNQDLQQEGRKIIQAQSIIQSVRKENTRLGSRIENYEKELRNLKQVERQLERQHVKMKQSDITIAQFQGKFKVMSNQIESLGQILRAKNQEIIRLEDENMKVVGLVSKTKILQNELAEKQANIDRIKKQLQNVQQKLIIWEQKVEEKELLVENSKQKIEGLEQEVKKKTRQCDDLRSMECRMSKELADLGELQKINQKQQNRITVYLRDIEDLRNINKQYEDAMQQQKKRSQQLSKTIKKLNETHNHMLDSNRSAQSKSGSLSVASETDPHQLLLKIGKLQLRLKDLQIKYEDLLRDVEVREEGTGVGRKKNGHRRKNTGNNSVGFQSNSGTRSMIDEVEQSAFENQDSG